jgi:hypothetical protein
MRRVAVLGAILLTAIWAAAQFAGNPNDSIRGSERETTVQGCLDISGLTYTLTLPSGTVFELTGNTAPLKAHVGEALQVRGVATPVMNEPGSMSEGEQTAPTIWVTSFQRISGACTATSNAIP